MPQPHQKHYLADTIRLQLAALPALRQVHDEHFDFLGNRITARKLAAMLAKKGVTVSSHTASALLDLLDDASRRGGHLYFNPIPSEKFDEVARDLKKQLDAFDHGIITQDGGYTHVQLLPLPSTALLEDTDAQ